MGQIRVRRHMGGGDNTQCRQRSSNSGGSSSSVGGSSSSSSSDIVLASPHLRTSSSSVAELTSSPLHSYVPLLEKRKMVSLQQLIQSSPYNPRHEIPMVWNVPLSDGGSTIELVFGNCLKLVQRNGRGHEIISQEHALEFGGTRVVVYSSSRRAMMRQYPLQDNLCLHQYHHQHSTRRHLDEAWQLPNICDGRHLKMIMSIALVTRHVKM